MPHSRSWRMMRVVAKCVDDTSQERRWTLTSAAERAYAPRHQDQAAPLRDIGQRYPLKAGCFDAARSRQLFLAPPANKSERFIEKRAPYFESDVERVLAERRPAAPS